MFTQNMTMTIYFVWSAVRSEGVGVGLRKISDLSSTTLGIDFV